MTRIYTQLIRSGLEELASETRQRALWLESEDPGMSSFEEAVCRVYDDSGLGHALDANRAIEGLSEDAITTLRSLERALRRIDPYAAESVPELIANPQMDEIRSLAASALEKLPDPSRGRAGETFPAET